MTQVLIEFPFWGSPDGSVVKNTPASSRDVGLILDLERSHMPQSDKARKTQLWSLCSSACEPQLRKPCSQSPCSAAREATTMQSSPTKLERSPRSPQLEESSCCSEDPVQCSSVQLLSRFQLFATPRTAACQASLSITSTRDLPKLMSIDSVMPSNHLILYCPLSPPALNLSQHQGLFK